MSIEQKKVLLHELEKLHERNELSKNVAPDYFEPGKMEYLDQSEGYYSEDTGDVVLRFESKGTRYDGRTETIEKVKPGDSIDIIREETNPYNSNNFFLLTKQGKNVGNMPAELCNAIAPLFDSGQMVFTKSFVNFVEPISKRSRYAKQAVLFVELHARLNI